MEFSPERKVARIRIDDPLDLWHLQNILEAGDFLTAKTLRTIFIQKEEGKEKGEKKFFTLKINVEKIEFDKYKNELRVSGKIVEAPKEVQKGSYHTIEIGLGISLTLEKEEWKKEQVERMGRAKVKISVAKDLEIQDFFVHVSKDDGLAAYGVEQVKAAAEMGAVKAVFISEEKIHEKASEELIKEIESKRGEIKIVSRKRILGEKFCRAYDIAAVLRFRLV
jgi:stalled ribosome rescue protein Dom34